MILVGIYHLITKSQSDNMRWSVKKRVPEPICEASPQEPIDQSLSSDRDVSIESYARLFLKEGYLKRSIPSTQCVTAGILEVGVDGVFDLLSYRPMYSHSKMVPTIPIIKSSLISILNDIPQRSRKKKYPTDGYFLPDEIDSYPILSIYSQIPPMVLMNLFSLDYYGWVIRERDNIKPAIYFSVLKKLLPIIKDEVDRNELSLFLVREFIKHTLETHYPWTSNKVGNINSFYDCVSTANIDRSVLETAQENLYSDPKLIEGVTEVAWKTGSPGLEHDQHSWYFFEGHEDVDNLFWIGRSRKNFVEGCLGNHQFSLEELFGHIYTQEPTGVDYILSEMGSKEYKDFVIEVVNERVGDKLPLFMELFEELKMDYEDILELIE